MSIREPSGQLLAKVERARNRLYLLTGAAGVPSNAWRGECLALERQTGAHQHAGAAEDGTRGIGLGSSSHQPSGSTLRTRASLASKSGARSVQWRGEHALELVQSRR
jgi:hypothetical protein